MLKRKHLVFWNTNDAAPVATGYEVRVYHEAMPELSGVGSSARDAASNLLHMLNGQLESVVGWKRVRLSQLAAELRRYVGPPPLAATL